MSKYRKKPVVIEAVLISPYMDHLQSLLEWIGSSGRMGPDGSIFIKTLEGTMTGVTGDYIIKGVQGEFYPCKPDIFEQTYESVL